MPLLIGDSNTREEIDQNFAALQAWAGKVEGMGKWIDVPYSAGLYGSSTGLWTVETGDQIIHAYALVNDTMYWNVRLLGTSTDSDVSNTLYVTLPQGYRMTELSGFQGVVAWNTSSANGTGLVFGRATPVDNMVSLLRDVASPSTDWPNPTTNELNISFNLAMRVRREF